MVRFISCFIQNRCIHSVILPILSHPPAPNASNGLLQDLIHASPSRKAEWTYLPQNSNTRIVIICTQVAGARRPSQKCGTTVRRSRDWTWWGSLLRTSRAFPVSLTFSGEKIVSLSSERETETHRETIHNFTCREMNIRSLQLHTHHLHWIASWRETISTKAATYRRANWQLITHSISAVFNFKWLTWNKFNRISNYTVELVDGHSVLEPTGKVHGILTNSAATIANSHTYIFP